MICNEFVFLQCQYQFLLDSSICYSIFLSHIIFVVVDEISIINLPSSLEIALCCVDYDINVQ